MQLFKSEWLFEPHTAAAGRDMRPPRFTGRYGVRSARTAPPVCPPLHMADAPALSTIEHERAVLRFLASYDRAA
ncbi:hypothetical protein ACFFGH_00720 [Lysobacter korlensis]|uniref:Uncharacterized protein n=1 Tax=Lysobacter korlensis TaxID=553636 RepID=A0ABV6RHA7_9GAMM